MECRRRTNSPGLEYTIETSTDLMTWETADEYFSPESATGEIGSVWLEIGREQTTSEVPDHRRFIRLRLERESP